MIEHRPDGKFHQIEIQGDVITLILQTKPGVMFSEDEVTAVVNDLERAAWGRRGSLGGLKDASWQVSVLDGRSVVYSSGSKL